MEQPLKIALLTNNHTISSYYFIRKMRAHFSHTRVICTTPKLSLRQYVKKIKSVFYFKATLQAHQFLLKYDYPRLQDLLPVQNPELIVEDINDQVVKDYLQSFNPDVLCILGTKKIQDSILETAPICLNIHGGFVPYYRGVSSPAWTTIQHNFPYLSYCIHKATNFLDQGHVWVQEHIPPYFYESFGAYTQRLTFSAINKLAEILQHPLSYENNAQVQPTHADAKNYRHRDKPADFSSQVQTAFTSTDANYYKYQLPRTNRIEKKWVTKDFNFSKTTMSPGWYIVCYHEIGDVVHHTPSGLKIPAITTSYGRFKEHLDFYHENFKIISLKEGCEKYKNNEVSQGRFLTITFDDGLRSIQQATALLDSVPVKPTFFLNTQATANQTLLRNHRDLFLAQYLQQKEGQPKLSDLDPDVLIATLGSDFQDFTQKKYLTKQEIIQLCEQGKIEIGSHTRSHIDAGTQNFELLKDEILQAHHDLETLLARNIPYFSFPFGKRTNFSWVAEYMAMQTSQYYFACFGGVNKNLVPGMLLRIAIHNESIDELEQLLTHQFIR